MEQKKVTNSAQNMSNDVKSAQEEGELHNI